MKIKHYTVLADSGVFERLWLTNTFFHFHVHHIDSNILSHCVPQHGWTALMSASKSGHTDVVRLLLSSGSKVDQQNKVRHSSNL